MLHEKRLTEIAPRENSKQNQKINHRKTLKEGCESTGHVQVTFPSQSMAWSHLFARLQQDRLAEEEAARRKEERRGPGFGGRENWSQVL